MIKKTTTYCFIFGLLFSCAPKIKNFNKYQKQFFPKTSFMPSQDDLNGRLPKVVVFSLDENSNQTASKAGLGTSIANNIENVLAKNKLAQIVDRNAADKLQQEIALAEINKSGSYKGPQIAEYAISAAIGNASFNSKYSAGGTFLNPKTGTIVTVPPKYKYNSLAVGNIKIYELPSLNVLQAIEFNGRAGRTEDARNNGGVNFGGISIGGEQVAGTDRDDGLVRKAGEDAIDNIKAEIQNIFAKQGYIMEKRIFKKKSIFKINLGSSDGIAQGDKFEIIGQFENQNSINNQVEVEKRIIATGKISDIIDPKNAWIIIDDSENNDKIRLGDAVKIKYKKNKIDKIAKVALSMIE